MTRQERYKKVKDNFDEMVLESGLETALEFAINSEDSCFRLSHRYEDGDETKRKLIEAARFTKRWIIEKVGLDGYKRCRKEE